jgi:hypothetical protein
MAVAPTAPKPHPKAKRLSGAASYLVWGSLAVCAVVTASVLIALGIGASRGGFGVAQTTTVRPPPTVVQKPQAASEFEVARLNDALRALAAERERLAARVDQLERSVGDITASVNTVKERSVPSRANVQPEAKPTAASPVQPLPAIAAEPTEQPSAPTTPRGAIAQSALPASVQVAAPPPVVELEPAKPPPLLHPSGPGQLGTRPPSAPKAVRTSSPPPAQVLLPPVTAAKGPPTQVAQIMPPANMPTADSGANKTEFAIDLGGDMSIDGLRARWANIKGNHGAALEGLRPLVSVREGPKPGTVELRLIAGPVANAGDAARVCAGLQTKGVACRTTEFDGQRLSLR